MCIRDRCIHLDDLVGARVAVRRTLGKYLDAVNFAGGNPTADPQEELPPEIWIVQQKTAETAEVVQFSLSSALDFNGQKLPDRPIIAGVCSWLRKGGYRGPYCGYTGSRMFDLDGKPVSDPTLDRLSLIHISIEPIIAPAWLSTIFRPSRTMPWSSASRTRSRGGGEVGVMKAVRAPRLVSE